MSIVHSKIWSSMDSSSCLLCIPVYLVMRNFFNICLTFDLTLLVIYAWTVDLRSSVKANGKWIQSRWNHIQNCVYVWQNWCLMTHEILHVLKKKLPKMNNTCFDNGKWHTASHHFSGLCINVALFTMQNELWVSIILVHKANTSHSDSYTWNQMLKPKNQYHLRLEISGFSNVKYV